MSGISSTVYDRLMRLPIICFTAYFFITEILSLDELLARPPIGWDWSFASAVAARVSLLAFLGLLILFHSIRSQPVNKAAGWEPKVSALLGLTLGSLFMLMDRPELSLELNLVSTLLLLVGNYFCIVALMHLGRSLSIMAEARRLVTTGPYALVRHPLYLAEEVSIVGVFVQFLSWQAVLVLMVHFFFQVRRMLNEEKVLSATFPEYSEYARRTPRLIPGVW
jgi:protein-S-isoprenylcysteine O-methyltransferase Ste14